MDNARFNPFEDRLSRDIRNDLSKTIAEVLQRRSPAPAQEVAATYRGAALATPYRDYIDRRLARYAQAVEILRPGDDLLRQAAVLWDLGLFFEVHEILEPAWMAAGGDEKRLLQALIRAAGVYLNLELGYRQRARKIALKTVPVLNELGAGLAAVIDAARLIEALETLAATPPRIGLD